MKLAVTPPIQVGGSLLTAKQLSAIASVLTPGASIEMTPFKQLYVEILVDERDEIQAKLEGVGLKVYPSGFVTKSIVACNFCNGAEEAGLETARTLNRALAGIDTPTPMKIGYAGCALGTSEPLVKDISVVKMRNTFDIYVGGESKGLKTQFAQKLADQLTEDQLIPIVTRIIMYYKENAKGKEKFSRFVNRISTEELRSNVL